MKKAFAAYMALPIQARIIILALVVVILVKLIQALKNSSEMAQAMLAKPTDNSRKTITNEQADLEAQKLLDAMKRAGTDDDELLRVAFNYAGADLKQIYKAFGNIHYLWYGQLQMGFLNGLFTDKKNLFEWFEHEVEDETTLYHLRDQWAKSGINWKVK